MDLDKAGLRDDILFLEAELKKALRERDEARAQLAERDAQCADVNVGVKADPQETITDLEGELIKDLRALAKALSRLPDEVKNCTIQLKECGRGHAWLTAANWVQHGCLVCELEAARAQCAEMRRAIESLRVNLLPWKLSNALEGFSRTFEIPKAVLEPCLQQLQNSLSTDAGKGWVSPEEHEAALKEAYENVRKRGEQATEVLAELEQAQAENRRLITNADIDEADRIKMQSELEQTQAEAADWRQVSSERNHLRMALLEEREKLRAVAEAATALVESDLPYTREQVARVRAALDALEKPESRWDSFCRDYMTEVPAELEKP